jgi:hypothetical protein
MSLNQLLYTGPDASTVDNRKWLNIVVESLRFGSNSGSKLANYYSSPALIPATLNGTNIDGPGPIDVDVRLDVVGRFVTLTVDNITFLKFSGTNTTGVTLSYTVPTAYRPPKNRSFTCPFYSSVGATYPNGVLYGVMGPTGTLTINGIVGQTEFDGLVDYLLQPFCVSWTI